MSRKRTILDCSSQETPVTIPKKPFACGNECSSRAENSHKNSCPLIRVTKRELNGSLNTCLRRSHCITKRARRRLLSFLPSVRRGHPWYNNSSTSQANRGRKAGSRAVLHSSTWLALPPNPYHPPDCRQRHGHQHRKPQAIGDGQRGMTRVETGELA